MNNITPRMLSIAFKGFGTLCMIGGLCYFISYFICYRFKKHYRHIFQFSMLTILIILTPIFTLARSSSWGHGDYLEGARFTGVLYGQISLGAWWLASLIGLVKSYKTKNKNSEQEAAGDVVPPPQS